MSDIEVKHETVTEGGNLSLRFSIMISYNGNISEQLSAPTSITFDKCDDLQFLFKCNSEAKYYIDIYIKAMKKVEYKPHIFKIYSKSLQLEENIFSGSEQWSFLCSAMYYSAIHNVYLFNFDLNIDLIKNNSEMMMRRIYEDSVWTDFELCAEDGSVKMHRACLAARSPVICTMLAGEWKETAEGRVQLPGVTMQTLQQLKDYIYLGKLPDTVLTPLLQLGHYFMIKDLIEDCINKVKAAHTQGQSSLFSDMICGQYLADDDNKSPQEQESDKATQEQKSD